MPTPNTSSPVEASSAQPDSSRPTRPQLACPEDIVAPTPTQEQPTTRTDSLTPSDAEVTTPASVEESPQTTESDRAETMSPAPAPCPETVSAEIVVSTVAVASPTTSLSPTSPKAMQSPKDGVGRKKAATVDGLVAGTRRSLVGTASQTDTHIPWVSGPTHDISNRRVLPSYSSSYLRPGRTFVGKQTSDKSEYEVQVELKHVDMTEAFLCGYLRIQGLTDEHPTLTTYFEGEMISDRYFFLTDRPEWGSSRKTDMEHWGKFKPAFDSLRGEVKRNPKYVIPNWEKKEIIFMRWKEYFLVPDHRVKQINGASFEGFYYIMFNQWKGRVEGIYFHSKSEKFQQLNLKSDPVQERTFRSCEFR